MQALAGVDPTVVFECVGVKGTINARDAARRRCAAASSCSASAPEMDEIFPLIGITKELELAFALAYSQAEFAEALEALRSGTIDVTPLVTDVIDLADVPDAFRALERPSTQCKVLIEFA